jgi:hypothetical protein
MSFRGKVVRGMVVRGIDVEPKNYNAGVVNLDRRIGFWHQMFQDLMPVDDKATVSVNWIPRNSNEITLSRCSRPKDHAQGDQGPMF